MRKLPADPAVLAVYLERHNSCNADPRHPMLPADEAAFSGSEQFSGRSEHGPWTLTSATSLRSYRFVKTAPANYTGGASMGTTVCVSP
ncbi:MAG: hypothetical protein ACLQB1_17550 [Streptosporangiaceae bacterium]